MNDILLLKGPFDQKSNPNRPGSPKLASGAFGEANHLRKLQLDIEHMIEFWSEQKFLSKALISVFYNKVVAKSNRITNLLFSRGVVANDTIVGAKFQKEQNKHIITHYMPINTLIESLERIKIASNILDKEFNGKIDHKTFNESQKIQTLNYRKYGIAKTTFLNIIVDSSYVEKIGVENNEFDIKKQSIITLYKTDKDIKSVLNKIGIQIYFEKILDDTSILLDPNQIDILMQKAPYLIAMATENISELSPENFESSNKTDLISIPDPILEPTIGVIDTFFDSNVYFSKWVEYHHMVSKEITVSPKDYRHGTAVSSIIVDGPRLNPKLEDGCGRFRVRHFGVSTNDAFSSFTIIRLIKEIITANKDIRVWNLSLGSNEEVHRNFISAEAAILDQIQYENDVIFVIAGTNKRSTEANRRIGAPADSINSLTVNAVDFQGMPTDYTRRGIVLSFFTKPDISYYGGSKNQLLTVCEPLGEARVSGTSFAAPWIARKLSYLIDILGFNREIAKAMIIDSSIGWNKKNISQLALVGHGTVPIHINDIVKSQTDEIKFVLSGISEKYDTYNYNFPVPIYKNEYPFVAKATLCYFPKCSRNQGVDYTNTELDLYFGRIDDNDRLKSINNNIQSLDDGEFHYMFEEDARKNYRKWDNVKHIQEVLKENPRGRKVYTKNKFWGMSIKTKERLNRRDGEGIRFGVVVTLKEIKGVNRIDDFIQLCSLRGWLVNKINIENKIDIYQTASENIDFK
jgi:hypothetical protein